VSKMSEIDTLVDSILFYTRPKLQLSSISTSARHVLCSLHFDCSDAAVFFCDLKQSTSKPSGLYAFGCYDNVCRAWWSCHQIPWTDSF